MSMFRTYRMTISSIWYDRQRKAAVEHELHFKVVRPGDVAGVRNNLTRRGIEYFQRYIYRQTGKWVALRRIKVKFERE